MKKVLLVAACILATASALAQGQVTFGNKAGAVNAAIFDVDGVTKLDSSMNAWVQLMAGPTASSLAAIGSPVAFRAPGAGAGYFPNTLLTIPTIPAGGSGFCEVLAWKGAATYEAASIKGSSGVLALTLTAPPAATGVIDNLKSFSLIPEPSTIALAILGLAALLLRRR